MRFFALSLQQKHIPLYLFTASASDLTRIVRLAHRSRDERLALQRTLDRKRLKEIAVYLARKDSLIANNIILNFDETVRFEPEKLPGIENAGYLTLPDDRPCATILDGQHRLMGFQLAQGVDFELAGIGFLNLDEHQAADIFTVINTTQKPLSKSLLLDIRHYIGRTSGEEKVATNIALALNNDRKSPLYDQVRVARKESGVITLDALARLIMPFIDLGGVLERARKQAAPIFRDYLSVFFSTFELPLNTAGLSAALSPVFERTIRRGQNLNVEAWNTETIERILEPVTDFRWDPDLMRNRKGRTKLIREFLLRLPEGNQQELQEWLL